MKTSFNLRFAGIFMALILTAGIALSGNYNNGKGRNRSANATCVNRISGLTQDQKDKITALATSHQTAMNNFRDQRRSTTDLAQKDQIRQQMNTEVTNHRSAVRALLTPDQQQQFDQLPRSNGSQGAGYGQGNNSRGSAKCNGGGQGNGCGRRGR